MRGEILSYDDVSGAGLISGDDSLRYSFDRSALQGGPAPAVGVRVDFVPEGMEALQIVVLAAAPAAAFGQASGSGSVSGAPAAPGIDWKALFFSFNGRLRRSHFWIGWAILLILAVVFSFVPKVSFFVGLVLLVGHLSIGFKRFHDMGKPGWLVVIPWAIWYACYGLLIAAFGLQILFDPNAINAMAPDEMMTRGLSAFGALFLASLISFGFWIWLGAGGSQPGPNRYGPNPKGQ